MTQGSFHKAMRQYTRALELDPGNAVLYSNRSATHFNLRQFAESLEDAESAILCDEKWWKAYKRKGLALIHMQRYEEAIEALREGLKIVGKNAEMEKNLEFAQACQEQAQNLYILPEPHLMNRLESVPVFIVTDEVSQPFFVTYEDGQQVCTFYFDKADADMTLDWIQKENPDIGSTARVIHITLNQAFSLAQETQKQYYDETTRAAVEEDLAAARAAEQKPDVDQDETEGDTKETQAGNDEGESAEETSPEDVEGTTSAPTDTADATAVVGEHDDPDGEDDDGANGGEADAAANPEHDDSIIDDNVPLSFQFRPELRQVEVAVELLNKHPNPPVKPILRDPPSVKAAKAKAREEAAQLSKETQEKDGNTNSTDNDDKAEEEPTKTSIETSEETASAQADKSADQAEAGEKPESDRPVEGDDAEGTTASKAEAEAEANGAPSGPPVDPYLLDDDDDGDDDTLTVKNFNGIPVFHAKGLTLLQNGQPHVPLFCSKWDLEAAWDQLVQAQAPGITGKCEVEVGTLEDVLRRMSESKSGEFENVIFVPSRESMQAIGQKFPLDDLATRRRPTKPAVKKANYSRAREIKARGGTPEEIRAAIEEDLKLYRERQKMAEMVAQLNQTEQGAAAVAAAAAAAGNARGGSAAAAASAARRHVAAAGAKDKPLSGHARRSKQREAREKSALATPTAAPAVNSVPGSGAVPGKEMYITASPSIPGVRGDAGRKAKFADVTAAVAPKKAATAGDGSA